jgi:hypothetical protein
MTSGADPFSILSKNAFTGHSSIGTGGSNTNGRGANNKPKVRRYRPGVKPKLEGNSGSDSDSDDRFDMFSDNKTQISKFTANTGTTLNTNLGLD